MAAKKTTLGFSKDDLVIGDDAGTPDALVFPLDFARGGVPRDFAVDPVDMFAGPETMKVIARSEWDDRIAAQEKEESSLEHVRLRGNGGNPIPSLDQNGKGYCWAHSVTNTLILQRAAANAPYVPLSAYAVACIIKGYRDEGGWCGLSAKFARERGVPSEEFWPARSMSRANDRPETWENAALHKITEDWVDLAKPVYDNRLTFDQVATCLLLNVPVALDFNWWSHSVCGVRLVRVSAGNYGVKIWNSWADTWGDRGMGVLTGSKCLPDGAVATRSTTLAA